MEREIGLAWKFGLKEKLKRKQLVEKIFKNSKKSLKEYKRNS